MVSCSSGLYALASVGQDEGFVNLHNVSDSVTHTLLITLDKLNIYQMHNGIRFSFNKKALRQFRTFPQQFGYSILFLSFP